MNVPTNKTATTAQPQGAMQMSVVNPAENSNNQECQRQKASRLRGGGVGKDCFLGALECFFCFGCPCEMCC
ncbi:hypothetical protein JAAARDRAFT_121393 [Jaapia argillacea MUCL 33604]|uniref:Uncharacterized protein n=1 Tax=Jaapia argillacea MUCL 33604 TaxID=933084 RepID=A0A067QGV5_9AGAM|nr:hypothetical protein JAAARDRAFT_121393 [Jaapia argillacea MUCL 33604]